MNFTSFTATPKKKTKGWPKRDAEGGIIPYKAILVDMQVVNTTTSLEETDEYKSKVAMGIIDEDDEEDLEDEEHEKQIKHKETTSQGVITFVLLGNHINGKFKWFNIEDLQYHK